MAFHKLMLLALMGCATTTTNTTSPKGGPRGLRASDHVDIAQQHQQLAHDRAIMPARFDAPDGNGIVWLRTWQPNIDHERIAEEHRGQAAELQAIYEKACGERALADISVSPLQRYAIGGWPTSTGIIRRARPETRRRAPQARGARPRGRRAASPERQAMIRS